MRVSSLFCLVALLGSSLPFLRAQLLPAAASVTSPSESFQIVMRSAIPQFSVVKVTFSPDEHYAALGGQGEIIVYDLRFGLEVRRIELARYSAGFASTMAFAHRSDTLYVGIIGALYQCDLDTTGPCTIVRNDIASAFVQSSDDHLAYIDTDNKIRLLDTGKTSSPIKLPETIPVADKDKFNWDDLALFEDHGAMRSLAVTGEIARNVKVFDTQRNRTVSQTVKDSRTSVFDMRTHTVSMAYVKTPLSVDEVVFDPKGELLLCGRTLDKGDDNAAPSFLYDFNAGQIVPDTDLSRYPSSTLDVCLDRKVEFAIYGDMLRGQDKTRNLNDRGGWLSPSGKYMLATDTRQDGEIILSLAFPQEKNAPVILAGSAESITGVEFIPGRPMLMTRGVMARHYWDYASGQIGSYEADSRWNADGTLAANFMATAPPGQGLDLYVQDMHTNGRKKTAVHLEQNPVWYGLSRSGTQIAVQEENTLSVYSNGTATPLQCKWHKQSVLDLSISAAGVHPSIDPTGKVLSAFCERNEDDPTSPGLALFLVAWNIETLKEFKPIPAHGFTSCGSIGPDGKTAILCGRNKLRIADLEAGTYVDTDEVVTDLGEKISAAQLQGDGTTIALGIDNLTGGYSQVAWFDRHTKVLRRAKATQPTLMSFATDWMGNVAVVSNDNVTGLFNFSGVRLIRLISIGYSDWMTLSDGGLFDGTSTALKWVAFRQSSNTQVVPAERLFNELYSPGLMRQAATGQAPQLTSGMSMSTLLELPGLRLLLEEGAHPQLVAGKAALCFDSTSLFDAVKTAQASTSAFVADGMTGCSHRYIFADKTNPAKLVEAVGQLKNARPKSPWDGQTMNDTGGTVNLFTVGVSKYSDPSLPLVPTAVPSTQKLAGIFNSHAAGTTVKDWGKDCGGLYNSQATKAKILACLDQMVAAVKPEDMVVLIVAGHGGTAMVGTTQSELFYYYPSDFNASTQGTDGAISSAELADRIRNLSAKRLVVVVDACDSGAVLDPLEGAVAARIQQFVAVSSALGGSLATVDPNVQGILFVTASSGIEDAISGSTANPFMDKLASLLLPQSGGPQWSASVATKMAEPITVSTEGQTHVFTPVALTLGANFILTKP